MIQTAVKLRIMRGVRTEEEDRLMGWLGQVSGQVSPAIRATPQARQSLGGAPGHAALVSTAQLDPESLIVVAPIC